MKTKLTITVDQQLIPIAKRYAAKQGRSLSGVVEEALVRLVQSNEPNFSQKWRGKFKLTAKRNDPRYDFLAKRLLK
jgi:hypothetical protein